MLSLPLPTACEKLRQSSFTKLLLSFECVWRYFPRCGFGLISEFRVTRLCFLLVKFCLKNFETNLFWIRLVADRLNLGG